MATPLPLAIGSGLAAIAIWMGSISLVAGVQEIELPGILQRAHAYLAALERVVTAVVADEDYRQRASSQDPGKAERRLSSELSVVRIGALEWIAFRDVAEVDGKPVRDRDERIRKIFQSDGPSPLQRAQLVVAEGARYNLDPPGVTVFRTINNPFLALRFLRADQQHRFEFRRRGTRRVGGREGVVIWYRERDRPRVIRTADNAPVMGSFVIEPDTGRVLWSEVQLETRANETEMTSSVRVTFAHDPKSDQWLPASMEEVYSVRKQGRVVSVVGHATYSNFRLFSVTVDIRR
jgi:hypothetical protein